MTVLSGDIRLMRIFAGVPWGRGVKRQWGNRERQFSTFSPAIFAYSLEMRRLCGNMQSVVGFSVIPNAWPWMTFSGYFALNSVFASVWLADTVQLSKNNCMKTNKDKHVLSPAQILGRDCSFCSGQIDGEPGGMAFPFRFSRGTPCPWLTWQISRDSETELHWTLWNTEKPTSPTGLSSVQEQNSLKLQGSFAPLTPWPGGSRCHRGLRPRPPL